YEAEIEEVREEQLPILVHVVEESLPVDLVALPQDNVGDVRAVVFVPVLDEGLGPHELGRREDADLAAVDLCGARVREPGIVDGRNGGRGIEDDVEELFAERDLRDPALVLDLRLVAAIPEIGEDLRKIAGAAEDVEILRRAM